MSKSFLFSPEIKLKEKVENKRKKARKLEGIQHPYDQNSSEREKKRQRHKTERKRTRHPKP